MDAFEKNCEEHIAAYGPENHLRLTGLHETQSIDKFSWGVADRGASIRVPHSFVNDGYKGYWKIVVRTLKVTLTRFVPGFSKLLPRFQPPRLGNRILDLTQTPLRYFREFFCGSSATRISMNLALLPDEG